MIAEPLQHQPGLFQTRIEEGIRSILENGYYVIENALSPDQCSYTVQLLDEMIERGESDGNGEEGGFGYHISPLCPRHTHFCDILCDPIVLGVAAGVLEDEPILKVNGTRVSQTGLHTARLGWHIHRYTAEENTISSSNTERGARPRRLVCTWYMEGCNAASGPLVVLPRRFDDPLAPPLGDTGIAWPGEVHVSCPPGSAVLFTTDLWHAAITGTSREFRHLIGVHFQGKHNPRPHQEDEAFEGPAIEAAVRDNPIFARMLGRD